MNYRAYFNRKNEFPQVWSVDQGDQSTEINVKDAQGHKVNWRFVFDSSIKPNPDVPCAWIEIEHATMQIHDGVAHFYHDPDWRKPRLTDEVIP